MKDNKNSKIRKRKHKKESQYDTFSLTMELKTPLITEEELEKEKIASENRRKKKMYSKFKKVASLVLASIIIVSIIWISDSYKPSIEAMNALKTDSKVTITTGKVTEFMPTSNPHSTGIIIYPGAKVEANSYSVLARKLAEKGYPVYTIDMPFNLAILSSKSASNVVNENRDIEDWVIVGHSLGGVAATKAAEDIDEIKGIVYLASYPTNDSLKNTDKKVLSITGSKDGVLNFKKYIESENNLPKDSEFVEIEGGNHCQFGNYGEQRGDNEAVISSDKQQNITVESIDSFISENML